ncbi:FAD:protein FMN transferase [Sulfurimonas microaerophilic]|uniref:FAD:protein FMN transferase n=1 Tax=Sulfurimonas microaerophilic TaxID=3058392 RepID=UPI0027150DA3|nr:FAD:protein FMN transferase [Sulfurimonas sp. hsl 1-7]
MKRIGLIFLLLCIALSAQTRTQVHMGTLVSITVDDHQELIDDGFAIIREVDYALSSYKAEGDIYKLNYWHFVQIHPLTYEALKLSQDYYETTYGYFDITIGSITKDLYRFGENKEFIPHPLLLQAAKVGFSGLKYNQETAQISKGIKVDLGGMGKGFGVQKVTEFFIKKGVKKAIVAASGDIRCIGICKVGVQDPFSEGKLFDIETKKSVSGITTSGNYRRYVASQKNNHLISPYLRQSEKTFASITLISELSSSDLDAYATAVSVMPYTLAKQFLDEKPLGYILITTDKKLIISKNFEEYATIIEQ